MPEGIAYEQWRAVMVPMMERLYDLLDREEAAWARYERQREFVREARERGLDGTEPIPPASLFRWLRQLSTLPDLEREKLIAVARDQRVPMPAPVMLRDHNGRSVGLAKTLSKRDVAVWLQGEALVRGAACDYDSAYQLWFVYAELVLRDADIGAIVARKAPHRMGRKVRLCATETNERNADLARKERKRVSQRKADFGYRLH